MILEGSASTHQTPLAPNRAVWIVDAEAKTATAELLGGRAVITRRAKDNTLRGVFTLPLEMGGLEQSFSLADCASVYLAQQRAETLIRETMNKTHPVMYADLAKAEIEKANAEAGPDPF
ncbi:hypothetical protein MARCHEWKA_04630 [Brevundimonas phage vB_BpoS-Marchewka]|uniref:Uncharacterized protein n=1 Tax=Brevundimonas phage vB_BpoS-Marchewka TaxID=2948604 RepID=A0A9E7N4W1_9CAUD|nr:hypothetical protein MARCHEWKA_04630 [Brevundimonas phage vB_BpoS-Marchewka]